MTELEKTLAEPAEREAFRTACGTFIKHVPDAYWTENYGDGYDGVSPTIPLYEVFDDCGRTIYDFFLNILYDPDVKEQGLFADFRRQLFKNECRMNRLSAYERYRKEVPEPYEREEDPKELVCVKERHSKNLRIRH